MKCRGFPGDDDDDAVDNDTACLNDNVSDDDDDNVCFLSHQIGIRRMVAQMSR